MILYCKDVNRYPLNWDYKWYVIQDQGTSAISGVNFLDSMLKIDNFICISRTKHITSNELLFKFRFDILKIICFQSHNRMGHDSSSNKRETKWSGWRHFRIRWNRQKTSAGHNHKSLPSKACLSASLSAYNWYSNQFREKPHKSNRVKIFTTIKYW